MFGKNKNITFYKKGTYIYIEGEEDSDSVYIIENGEVEFSSSNQYIKLNKESAKKGDIFGFISALINRPRNETSRAKVDTSVIIIPKNRFITLLQKNSEIAFKLLNYYADELRAYDNLIFSLEQSKDIFSTDFKLYKLGEYYYNENNYSNSYYIFHRFIQMYPENKFVKEARDKILKIESTGLRKISEPMKTGIYNEYVDKQIIFCENEPGNELFIIKKGKVKIVKNKDNVEIMLSVLKEGDIFGELAIVSNKPRNATAISYGVSVILPINKNSFLSLFDKTPQILNRIFLSISKRVWFTYIRLEALTHKKPFTKIYAFLENKLIEDNISLKSNKPHTFSFGIDELLNMTDLVHVKTENIMKNLLNDSNLEFNFGQIIINDPSAISAKARFYRSRDNLYLEEEPAKPAAEETANKMDVEDTDMEVIPEHNNEKAVISNSSILKELDELVDL